MRTLDRKHIDDIQDLRDMAHLALEEEKLRRRESPRNGLPHTTANECCHLWRFGGANFATRGTSGGCQQKRRKIIQADKYRSLSHRSGSVLLLHSTFSVLAL